MKRLIIISLIASIAVSSLLSINDPSEVLIDHLNSIQLAYRRDLSENDKAQEDAGIDCKQELEYRKDQINQATLAGNRAEERKNRCDEQRAYVQSDLTNINGYNLDITYILNSERKGRTQEATQFKSRQQSLSDSILAIEKAFEIVKQFANSKAGAKLFAQLSSSMNEVFITSAKNGHGQQLTPLITKLLEVKASVSSAREVTNTSITEINRLLTQIQTKIKSELQILIDTENAAIQFYSNVQKLLLDVVKNLKATETDMRNYKKVQNKCIHQQREIIEVNYEKKSSNSNINDAATAMCNAYQAEYSGSTKKNTELVNEIEKLKVFIKERQSAFEAQSFF